MPPRKKTREPPIRCDTIQGEQFHADQDDVFGYNWWEVFCFPYILCTRVWDFCISLCAGTNQCMVYWLMVQWLVCKITRMTTPDPIIFPYYFYLFCQVILLTVFFAYIWHWFGKTIIIPYFYAFYTSMYGLQVKGATKPNVTRLSFRKYCFRKSEIFESMGDAEKNHAMYTQATYPLSLTMVVFELLFKEYVF